MVDALERYQVTLYWLAIVGGAILAVSGVGEWLAPLVTPVLIALLFATFMAIPT